MSAMAKEYGATNLSQGFPDFGPPEPLIEAVNKAMRSGNNQYAPMAGLPQLREAISDKIQKLYTSAFDPETEITITAGATQAIFTAIQALVHEGDEVLIFQPSYDCYTPAVDLANGKAVYYNLEAPDYKVDWAKVRKLVNHHTRMIIINTPHNPTGTTWNAFDLMQLEKLVSGHDIIVLSDEVYEHILFDGLDHQSVLRFPKLANQSLAVFSFGKTYHNTGWKVGYVVGPEALMKEFRKVHQYNVFSVNTPAQVGLAEYLKHEEAYLGLGKFYQEKRDFFRNGLKASRFKMMPCQGTYFQLLSFAGISEKGDVAFANELTQTHGVASIPVSVFYQKPFDQKVLRFCFAKSEDVLEEALEKLCKI
jgi:methionine aminotransferase